MTSYTQTSSAHSQHFTQSTQTSQRRHLSKQRFVADLSQCLFDFVIQLLPTADEMAVKEDVRKLLERLIRTIEPESRLLSFGSTGNGFALRNSDMDLCCLIDSDERLSATDLVTMLGDLLERETKFHVKPLPHARIPIVKLSLDPSPGLPLGIACDIGFENRLALENTRLLMCYAMVDPTRVRTIVLFLKVWSKRRKINAPYKGTLSSYGYVLLVIYFLVHVKNPPVLPNLQQMPPLRPISKDDTHLAGYNIWFFDDIDLLRQRWQSSNMESVAELLIDFFRYFSRDFSYNTGVASIRAGLLRKGAKGWQSDLSATRINDSRERNRFCIEDPFEIDFNVARCVTKDGLYTIRGEFMRASRILSTRPDRAIVALAELCEERKEEDLVTAPSYVPPRLSPLPPQTPYPVGSFSIRPKVAVPEGLSPQTQLLEPGPRSPPTKQVSNPSPPEHMAARRSKWTSPPPPEAPSADHSLFESQLGIGLELATAPTEARETDAASSCNSDVFSDEDHPSDAGESDDVLSVRSFTEGSTGGPTVPLRKVLWLHSPELSPRIDPIPSNLVSDDSVRTSPRGRLLSRLIESSNDAIHPKPVNTTPLLPGTEISRRSSSGPARTLIGFGRSSNMPSAPVGNLPEAVIPETATVVYQTTPVSCPSPSLSYSHLSGSQSPLLLRYGRYQIHSSLIGSTSPDTYPILEHRPQFPRISELAEAAPRSEGPSTPTPLSYTRASHSHSQSTSTVTSPTPPPNTTGISHVTCGSLLTPKGRSKSPSPPVSTEQQSLVQKNGSASPHASTSNGSESPTPSSSGYVTSLSSSPSPPSPPPPLVQLVSKSSTSDNDGRCDSGLLESPRPVS